MARIETDPNYSSPTFSRATAATDVFKKEDVQNLASAVSTHDHTSGKGLPVPLAAGSVNGSVLTDNTVTSAKIQDGTIVAGDIADGTITPAKIANRTRYAFIPAAAFQSSGGSPSFLNNEGGSWQLDAATTERVASSYAVPDDWDSGTIRAWLYIAPLNAGAAGLREVAMQLAVSATSNGGVPSASGGTDTISTGSTNLNLSIVQHSVVITVSAGQMLGIQLTRVGGDVNDDLASDLVFYGLRLEYTADS